MKEAGILQGTIDFKFIPAQEKLVLGGEEVCVEFLIKNPG
jgi:hypothetical protein